jgi:hypothetical protein
VDFWDETERCSNPGIHVKAYCESCWKPKKSIMSMLKCW